MNGANPDNSGKPDVGPLTLDGPVKEENTESLLASPTHGQQDNNNIQNNVASVLKETGNAYHSYSNQTSTSIHSVNFHSPNQVHM